MRNDLCGARSIVLHDIVVHIGVVDLRHRGPAYCARDQWKNATNLRFVSGLLEERNSRASGRSGCCPSTLIVRQQGAEHFRRHQK
jgi:hypothetical protein